MLTLVLVRHGEREVGEPDSDQPLTDLAIEQAKRLGKRLLELADRPGQILVSTHRHARQTVEGIVLGMGLEPVPTNESHALTPGTGGDGIPHWLRDELYRELKEAITDKNSIVLLVGHETRLSQIVLGFTGQRLRPLLALESICITAKAWKALWLGTGCVSWRYPVRNWLEGELTNKISSKMTVATFLASANFVGLIELLIGQRHFLSPAFGSMVLSPAECISSPAAAVCSYLLLFTPPFYLFWGAVVSQTIAAALFVVAVYMYDRLTMPLGFWLLDKPPRWSSGRDAESNEWNMLHGYLYAHMIGVWSRVFTPAVAFSTLAVLLVAAATGIGVLSVASLMIVLGAMVLFWFRRPGRSVD